MSQPTHKCNGKRILVRVWEHDTIIGGECGMPSVFKGDVYYYPEVDGDGVPLVSGHLTRSEFEKTFEPLPGHDQYHEECLAACESINGV